MVGKKRTRYIGSVIVGRRRVWSSPPQDSYNDAANYARGMMKQYVYSGTNRSRTDKLVSTSVRRV